MPVAILILFFSIKAFAFLDFIGEQAKKTMEATAYADAVAELSAEISPNTELKEGAKDIRSRSDKLKSEASTLQFLSSSTKRTLEGPDWSSRRLDSNIRSTTEYVRRLKTLIARISALGTDGATALNTTETNVALNEVQKNQQALILQNEDAKLRKIEQEQEEARQWSEFSKRQRHLQKREAKNGKL